MEKSEVLKQKEIIDKWVKETSIAYSINIEDVQDNQIISYLAQNKIGLHIKTFKVKFSYQKDKIGRRIEFEDIHIFDVYNSIELHEKINDYMREKYNDMSDRWHYPRIISIDKI